MQGTNPSKTKTKNHRKTYKMNAQIEIAAKDNEGFELWNRDFDTIKEAKEFMKTSARDRSFWVRRAESEQFPNDIDTIQLIIDGEIRND
jgi:hypothetical protein